MIRISNRYYLTFSVILAAVNFLIGKADYYKKNSITELQKDIEKTPNNLNKESTKNHAENMKLLKKFPEGIFNLTIVILLFNYVFFICHYFQ